MVKTLVSRLLTRELGFREERLIPSEIGFSTRARPDFVYAMESGRGILAEVERGGTTTNNHDLKDMWKAHIAPNAQHLFLDRSACQLERRWSRTRASVPSSRGSHQVVLRRPATGSGRRQCPRVRLRQRGAVPAVAG